jgi:hypothetical protein
MVLGMKTTLEIGDALFRQAKRRAADDGITFRQLVEQALRDHLAAGARPAVAGLRWYVIRGSAPPAVDVADRDQLYDFLDEQ